MKKSYAKEIARIALVLAGAGAFALALLGCPTDAGGGGGTGKPQTGPDAEDFGPNAVIAGTFTANTADALLNAIDAIRNGGRSAGNARAANTPNFIINISGNITMDGRSIEIDDFPCNISFRGTGTVTFNNQNNERSRLVIQENQTFTLRGPTLKGSGSLNTGDLFVVEAQEDCTFVLRSGTINANNVGQGMLIESGGRVEMYGGTITGTLSTWPGVGNHGTFTMAGGAISGNGGAGVLLPSSGQFIMTGGAISGNVGNGVQLSSSGQFTMTGGNISNNNQGVRIADSASFTMKNGTISGNSDQGVSVRATTASFTMEGGTISGNTKRGVFVALGTCTMTGGTISGNDEQGVRIEGDGTFTMTGGAIFGNSMHGVSVAGSSTFNLNPPAAKTSIHDNTGGQVEVSGTFKVNGATDSAY